MGLATTHDCWQGSYTSFNDFRVALCQIAGLGDLMSYEGCGGTKPWPSANKDPLIHLLHHSDCDGELEVGVLIPLAERLEALIPALEQHDRRLERPLPAQWFSDWSMSGRAKRFAAGCRKAAALGENVEFH